MSQVDVSQLVEILAKKTKNNAISWARLFSFEGRANRLYRKYITELSEVQELEISIDESYYTRHKEGFMFFLYLKDKASWIDSVSYILAIQSSMNADVIELNNREKYQADLIYLGELIQRNVNNIDNFILDLIEEE